jgi:hypothetical protein
MTATVDQASPVIPAPDGALVALTRLVVETEQRRSEQVQRIAQLDECVGESASADRVLAKRVLKEIEATLGMARAYQSILQSLDVT